MIVPAGRIVTEDGDVLRNVVDTLVQQGQVKIVLDLQQVTYVDSSGLGLMVSKYVSARRRGGDVKLLHRAHAASTCSRYAPGEVFEVFESEDDAVRAFGASSFQAHTV